MSNHKVIVITGAAGFIGSALTVDLAADHAVIAIDRREPSQALLDAAPSVIWRQIDIGDETALDTVFKDAARRFDRIDCVLHFAAFYHFGNNWRPEYQRTNIDGTEVVINAGIRNGAERLIFASSLGAMLPPSKGKMLTERSPVSDYIPYAKSKAVGEALIRDSSKHLPATVLRIAGVFSDWCELPPLDSLMRMWAGQGPFNRVMVGRGETAIPYIHRDDLCRLVRCCIEQDHATPPFEIFFASQHGAVSHRQLFDCIHGTRADAAPAQPIFVRPAFARIALYGQRALGRVIGRPPFEHPWMLDYVDRPWVADTTHTRQKLNWDCRDDYSICHRLPTVVNHFRRDRRSWERRSRARKVADYVYSCDLPNNACSQEGDQQ